MVVRNIKIYVCMSVHGCLYSHDRIEEKLVLIRTRITSVHM